MQKNDQLTVKILDINHEGFGVAKEESGRTLFVKDTVIGDEVTVKIIKVAKSYAVAIPLTYLRPSPDRIPPACTAAACGGCAYRLIGYERELLIKRESVRMAFKKASINPEVAPVLSNGRTAHYRNKAQFPVSADRNGALTFGYYARRSHRLSAADDCALTPPYFQEIARAVIEHGQKNGVIPYDESTGDGLLRHIFLRQAEGGREIMLALVVTSFVYPNIENLVESVRFSFPNVTSILLNENTDRGNVILGGRYRALYGPLFLRDTLCGVRLKIAPQAFYQVNREMAEVLYEKARELCELRGDETLLDLYCGTGSIGLSMAGSVRRVIGVEVVPEAVLCARENAEENGIVNAEFFEGDAGRIAERLAGEGLLPDVVILDPPRAGIDGATVAALRRMAPERIVYISCNPETLSRDVALLAQGAEGAPTYQPGTVFPVDLFPRTGHVESVVLLTRDSGK